MSDGPEPIASPDPLLVLVRRQRRIIAEQRRLILRLRLAVAEQRRLLSPEVQPSSVVGPQKSGETAVPPERAERSGLTDDGLLITEP